MNSFFIGRRSEKVAMESWQPRIQSRSRFADVILALCGAARFFGTPVVMGGDEEPKGHADQCSLQVENYMLCMCDC